VMRRCVTVVSAGSTVPADARLPLPRVSAEVTRRRYATEPGSGIVRNV
jgi:hypothetical protein